MTEMIEKLNEDIKDAMKKGEKERLDAIRYLKSMLMENKTSKKPIAEMDVMIAHSKKLKDSLVNFPEGNELRIKTEKEIGFLSVYLPQQMGEDEVKKIIKDIVAKGANNMGMIMKELTPQIKGRFDGKLANDFVKLAIEGKL